MRFARATGRAVAASLVAIGSLAVAAPAAADEASPTEPPADAPSDDPEPPADAPSDDPEPPADAPSDDPEPPPTTLPPEDPQPTVPPPTTAPPTTAPPSTPPAADAPDTPGPARATRVEEVPADTTPPPITPGRPSVERAVITEIHLNPAAVYDSRGEWFEVHNPTTAPLDLSGWTISDDGRDEHRITALAIQPGGYAVLARFGEVDRNGGVVADYVYGDSMLLFNAGDRIVLRDTTGAEVDRVDYRGSDFVRPNGRSISLLDPGLANELGANWCLSTTALPGGDLASPGGRTRCEESAATIVVTEILNNPAATSDFAGEWFELHNDGPAAVDLAGFTVKDDDGESFSIDRSLVVEPGGYVVLGVTTDPALNGDAGVDFAYGDRMRLHNTYDEIVVLDPAGVQVDAVRYDDGRTFPDPNGESMNLLDAGLDNSQGENWCESARRWAGGDLGSPGEAGTCDPEPMPELVITEIMFDPERTSPEREGEWFEVANVGEEPAVLDGFVLRTYATSHVVSNLTIAAGSRAVLASSGDPAENGGITPDYVFGGDLPLYNTVSTLEIEAPDGTELDHVKWSEALGFPNEKGHSIELRATDVPNELGANWCSTSDRYGDGDFGTPGAAGTCDIRPSPIPLLISEVMRNPAAVGDTYGEWFEIHNPTADPVDLWNWSVGDHGSDHHVIRDHVVVPPEGNVVVGRSGDLARNGDVAVDVVTGGAMVLLNSSDEIVLHDRYGQLVDEVVWDGSGLMPRPNGASMSRTPEALASFAPNNDVSQWCVTATQFGAGDRGTPGLPNDCAAAAEHPIVINEIHRDPYAVADAKGEWVELYNRGDVAVDLAGWTLRDDDNDRYVFDPATPLVLDPGGFLVLGRNAPELNGGIPIDVQYGVEFIHFNTADEIVLLDAGLVPIDRVAWTADNGFPRIPGAAMALVDPALDNSIGPNWCAAVTDQGNGDLGTPGAPNVCELEPEPAPTLPTELTHSLFSTGDARCQGLAVGTSKLTVSGDVRSNAHLAVTGSKVTLNGAVSYGGNVSIPSSATVPAGVVHEPAAQLVPFGWSLADFAPGGVRAAAAGAHYHHHVGSWITGAGGIAPGVHFVEGDVLVADRSIKLNEVTIVATGSITLLGSAVDLRPYASDLPALFSAKDQGTCLDVGIRIAASSIDFAGAVYAPEAHVHAGASVLRTNHGAIVGSTIVLAGSKVQLGMEFPPSKVRVTAMCKGTGEHDGTYKFRVRHESGEVDLAYRLQIGGRVLHHGDIAVGETSYVWLDDDSKGVKVVPAGPWKNTYGGTASSNGNLCS